MRLRHAVRAVIADPDDRVLLDRCGALDGGAPVWMTPGGGIEPGEDKEACLRRELAEELGLTVFELGPEVWSREHLVGMLGGFDGQREHFFLVHVEPFEPSGTPDPDVTEQRWWTIGELGASTERFAPRRLPELVAALLRDGPPSEPLDVGV